MKEQPFSHRQSFSFLSLIQFHSFFYVFHSLHLSFPTSISLHFYVISILSLSLSLPLSHADVWIDRSALGVREMGTSGARRVAGTCGILGVWRRQQRRQCWLAGGVVGGVGRRAGRLWQHCRDDGGKMAVSIKYHFQFPPFSGPPWLNSNNPSPPTCSGGRLMTPVSPDTPPFT